MFCSVFVTWIKAIVKMLWESLRWKNTHCVLNKGIRITINSVNEAEQFLIQYQVRYALSLHRKVFRSFWKWIIFSEYCWRRSLSHNVFIWSHPEKLFCCYCSYLLITVLFRATFTGKTNALFKKFNKIVFFPSSFYQSKLVSCFVQFLPFSNITLKEICLLQS